MPVGRTQQGYSLPLNDIHETLPLTILVVAGIRNVLSPTQLIGFSILNPMLPIPAPNVHTVCSFRRDVIWQSNC
jgi:hypothetical protein